MNNKSERVLELLKGAVDPHVHSGPSTAKRGIDHLQLLQRANSYGYKAILTKDHDYSGVACAQLISNNFPEIETKIYSGIVLNNVVGGLNVFAVEHTAAMGGKVVWLPTLAAENHLQWEKSSTWSHPGASANLRHAEAVRLFDAAGNILDELKQIFDVIAATDMTLAAGHVHVNESMRIFELARQHGVNRFVLTHPEEIVGGNLNIVREAARSGIFVEHSMNLFIPGSKLRMHEKEILRDYINAAGVEMTILCSDLGQSGLIDPVEGMIETIELCLELGYSDEDIRAMTAHNASRILNI